MNFKPGRIGTIRNPIENLENQTSPQRWNYRRLKHKISIRGHYGRKSGEIFQHDYASFYSCILLENVTQIFKKHANENIQQIIQILIILLILVLIQCAFNAVWINLKRLQC